MNVSDQSVVAATNWQRLRMLLHDSALRNRLGSAAAKTASHFTWELHAREMREFFEAAAQEKSRP